jgi:hypothetical protein
MAKVNYESLEEEKTAIKSRYDKLLNSFNVLQSQNDFNLREMEKHHAHHQRDEEEILQLKQENADLVSKVSEIERELNTKV